ncbi:MAG: XdhC/CoxI family protein [Saprospiraceae bacterium]
MKELLTTITDWTSKSKSFATATVIQTWGSSPRPIGSTMLVSEEMEMAGSVSGGCVEGAVVKASLDLIAQGRGQQLTYGVTDEDAWAVGLSCGGKMQVFAERFLAFDERKEEQAAWQQLALCLANNEACIFLSRLQDGPGFHALVLPNGAVHGQTITEPLKQEAIRAYQERKHQIVTAEGVSFFAQVFSRKPQMLIIGAAHITADLVRLAALHDFETIVIDPRGVFTQKTQFPHPPDQLLGEYPTEVLPKFTLDAYTYAVVLSHDPKIDDNALHLLLPSAVAYIGALGSRKTHAKRVQRLQEAGFSEEAIARIKSPIGLDINAKKPKEIALSIMAEIIAIQNAFL